MAGTVECERHGPQPEAFVCQHIAESLRTGQSVGFFWSSESSESRPDAWCRECNERVKRTGGEWVGEAAEALGVKLLCGGCYDAAKQLWLCERT